MPKQTNVKKLRYIKVYDELFHNIKEGKYPKGSQLPSEPELAKQMNVSRMTLRQSLALLQEDGIVRNIRGKGNFILNNKSNWIQGIETIAHPVYNCIHETIDEVEMEYTIEVPNEYAISVLQKETPSVVIVDRWYKVKGEVIAYSLSFLPVEIFAKFKIDMKHHNEVKQFLETTLYQSCNHSKIKVRYSEAGNFNSAKYQISKSKKFFLLEEALYYKDQIPCMHNKHYLPMELATIEVSAKR